MTIYIVKQHDGVVIRVHNNENDAWKFCDALNARLSETARKHRPYEVDYRIVWDHFEPIPCFGK